MSKQSANKQAKQLKAIMGGFTSTPPPNLGSFGVEGVTYTVADLLAKLGALVAILDAASDAEVEWQKALLAREAVLPEVVKLVSGTRKFLKSHLGARNPALLAYGIEPEKAPAPPTAEQKVARVQKAKATRAARHTMGPKQKAKITG
jgi:hypothetical protein